MFISFSCWTMILSLLFVLVGKYQPKLTLIQIELCCATVNGVMCYCFRCLELLNMVLQCYYFSCYNATVLAVFAAGHGVFCYCFCCIWAGEHGVFFYWFCCTTQSIVTAVGIELPNVEHRHCVRHIYANWNKSFKGEEMKLLFWRCAKAYNESDFNDGITKMEKVNHVVAEAFNLANPHLFFSSFCKGWYKVRCDIK